MAIETKLRLGLDKGAVDTGLQSLTREVNTGVASKLSDLGLKAANVWAAVGTEIKQVAGAVGRFALDVGKASTELGGVITKIEGMRGRFAEAFAEGIDEVLDGRGKSLELQVEKEITAGEGLARLAGEAVMSGGKSARSRRSGRALLGGAGRGAVQGAGDVGSALIDVSPPSLISAGIQGGPAGVASKLTGALEKVVKAATGATLGAEMGDALVPVVSELQAIRRAEEEAASRSAADESRAEAAAAELAKTLAEEMRRSR